MRPQPQLYIHNSLCHSQTELKYICNYVCHSVAALTTCLKIHSLYYQSDHDIHMYLINDHLYSHKIKYIPGHSIRVCGSVLLIFIMPKNQSHLQSRMHLPYYNSRILTNN